MIGSSPVALRGVSSGTVRTLGWLLLAVTEMLAITFLFDFGFDAPRYLNPIVYAVSLARWGAVTAALVVVLVWPRRYELAQAWASLQGGHNWIRALSINLGLFVLLAGASVAITARAAGAAEAPLHLLPAYGLLLVATGLSLLRIDVPLRGLVDLVSAWRKPVVTAATAGLAVVLLCEALLLAWPHMAGATLGLTAAILRLFEPDVAVDLAERSLQIGNFKVIVLESCSGYEGLALVTGFVTVYLWAFRAELRFPAALVLYPIGLSAIWLLNSARIAALTLLGAHVSPHMAVKGFHSQAGWIAFLMVSLGLIVLARNLAFTRQLRPAIAVGAPNRATATGSDSVPYLLPFAALMLGSIAMSVAAPHDRPVYLFKAAIVAAALWACRASYRWLSWRVSSEALAAGLLVGVAWIATDPKTSDGSLGDWLVELGPGLALAWLTVRGIGTIVLVPIAEELAFRGYLYRRMIGRTFESISPTQLSLVALIASSLLFGLLHDRWLAATLSGAVFALVMLRSGRVGDAIAAHAIANAIIFGWALAMGQWSLL